MDFTGIKHRGAKDGVSGSCHQLDINASASFLVNCGLFQGDDVSIPSGKGGSRQPIDFLLDAIKALVILPCSHRHIGTSAHRHIGRIPCLPAAGFEGPILCSEASAKLLPIVGISW